MTTEYRISIWRDEVGFLFSTGWQSEKDFKRAFQSVYEGFSPGAHTVHVFRREVTTTEMTAETMYGVLWESDTGKKLDEVQKEISGEDDIEDDAGVLGNVC